MRTPAPENREERQVLEAALKRIRDEWKFPKSFGLVDLLKKWQAFVAEVETGYSSSIYDYTHDLSMRDLLENLKGQVPPRLQLELSEYIAPWDKRFSAATRPVAKPIDIPTESCHGEWWYRVPNIVGSEMGEYLLSEYRE